MERKAEFLWIDSKGQEFPAPAGHEQFAHDILRNELIGTGERQEFVIDPATGQGENKGKSGEVAKAEAEDELNGKDTTKLLRDKGWVQVLANGRAMVIANNLETLKKSWPTISKIVERYDSAAFVVEDSGRHAVIVPRQEMSGDAERAIGNIQRRMVGTVQTAGLGMWVGEYERQSMSYFERE